MSQVDRLKIIAEELRAGKEAPQFTVREFLSWFKVERRRYWNVLGIQEILNNARLRTEPDFESAYLDSNITFSLLPEETSEGLAQQVTPEGIASSEGFGTPSVTISAPSHADPTYRISKLEAANNPPIRVAPDSTIEEVVTIMLSNDFSQLPVMIGEREVKGVVSWTSIGTRLSLGKHATCARELMDAHQEIGGNASLFQAIPTIVQHQYVLIRSTDNRIMGIVTASDLSLQFQQLSEPFLLLAEIENHIRRILGNKFSAQELAGARDPADPDREVTRVDDLTFGEYIQFLENPEHWGKLNLPIDRKTFIKQLEHVRDIRNDVMHFDPDGIPPNDLERLRDFVQFLQRLKSIGVT
ncbi:MAG: CBS domain-containing protein [Deltaproteobacteria bacterium]|nr:CBS domain-containing protein [Deltaproteobacteria bacterium]